MALIVGHSKVKYMHQYVRSDRITTLSFPGSRIRDLMEQGSVFDVIPDINTILLMVGGNDILRLGAEDVVSDILRLRDKIICVNPSATVIVSEILPRAMDEFPGARTTAEFIRGYNRTVEDVNQRLMKICRTTDGMRFVTVPGFSNREGVVRSLLSRDGLHLSPEGTRRVVKAYEGAICADWKNRESRRRTCDRNSATPGSPASSSVATPPSIQEKSAPTSAARGRMLYSQALTSSRTPMISTAASPSFPRRKPTSYSSERVTETVSLNLTNSANTEQTMTE